MSRRTPIKELIAEDAGTPSSPTRRSNRIATRRSTVQDEGGTRIVDESDRISISLTSSMRSRSGRKLRALSKSPLPLNNEDITKVPAKRTRKGSTSSLIEEELLSSNRGGSPTPGRQTRRSLARSLSVSPTSELESRNEKTSTSKKSTFKSATSKEGVIKKSRRLSVADTVLSLESIKELEQSPQKENVNKNSIENTDEKDLPLKKKKSVLLQTITEKSVKNVKDTTKSPKEIKKSSNQKEKLAEKTDKSSREKEKFSKETENSPNEKEKSLKETVKSLNQNDKSPNETENALNKVDLQSKKIIPSLSLKRRLNSNSSTEEKELIVLNSINKHDVSLNRSEDLNCSSSKENSYLKQQTDKLNSEDENLSLHISESEDSDEKDNNSLLNESCSSNKSMKKNVEEKIVPQTADVAPRDTKSTVEINIENIQEVKNSFCAPMDVDVTVLETSSPKLNLNDKETTSTVINVSKDLNQSDSEKLEHTEVDDKVDNNPKNACNTSTGSILNTSSKSDRSNTPAKEFKSPQKHKQITDNEDSPKNVSAPQDINTFHSDEVHLTVPKIETTEASFSSPKISSNAEVDKHGEASPQFSSPSNDNITISPLEELTKQFESLGQSNVSINKENNKIIVATNLTPVKRSPRLQISSDLRTKTVSNQCVSEDVLKINTPPDSVKSANSSVDELEPSGNEHKDVIAIEPSRQSLNQSFKTESNTNTSGSSKSAKRKRSLEMKKSSPIKLLFAKASTSDEQNVSDNEDHQLITKPIRGPKRFKGNATQEAQVALGEESGLKKDKKKKTKQIEVDLNTTEGDIEEQPKVLKRLNNKSRKTAKKLVVNNDSDSDMSPDLDKELNEKYNNSSEKPENTIKNQPKLVPSLNTRKRSWGSDQMNTFLKASTSSDIIQTKELNSVNVESSNVWVRKNC